MSEDTETAGDPCPDCGGLTLFHGFGLAGGGYGPYSYCVADGCEYFDKVQELDAPLSEPAK